MSQLIMSEGAAPSTPSSGKGAIFLDASGNLCEIDDGGRVLTLAAAGSFTLTIPATGTVALLATANVFTAGQTFAPSGTGTNAVFVNMPASTTATGIVVQYNSANYIRMLARATLTQIILDPNDFGNNVGGALLSIGRNTNGGTEGPAAGALGITQASGTARRIWPDASGDLRIHTAAPTGSSGSPTTSDTAGTVIGTQTSMADAKHITDELSPLSEVKERILAGAEAVRRFVYKSGSFGGQEFEGVVTDLAPAYGMDRDEDHPAGKSLNEIDILGDMLRMMAHLLQRLPDVA